ncbi:MAG: glycosyltransferase [Halobacteriovoraceae bacterium]|nr:glycosyltransferase [Halobacteriovoraceae bacterium]
MKNVSIIIVTKGRADLLDRLLKSLKESIQNNEIVIILNDDKQIDSSYNDLKTMYNQSEFKWIHREFKTPGLARNEGVKNSSCEWILFLDDDVATPLQFIEEGALELAKLDEEHLIMGGPDQNFNSSSVAEAALSLTLTSPMATAHTRFRHKKSPDTLLKGDETNLILCNLWVHRNVFTKFNIWFRESFFRNEENVFISEAQKKGIKAVYNPRLAVFHQRKTRLDLLGKALISSGKHRIKSLLIHREIKHFIFLIPAGWVIYLLGLKQFSQFTYGFFPLQLYIALTIFISLKITSKHPQLLPLVILYQIFINFFYGVGILWGLICFPFWSRRKNQL